MTHSKKFWRRLIIPAFLLQTAFSLMAEPATEAETAICVGCHGEGGVSMNPMVPTLAGQPYSLIEDNLLAFRAGRRACAPGRNAGSAAAVLAQTMCTAVAQLSDEDIADLARYFESQQFEAADQSFDSELVARGAQLHVEHGCERCHADGGRETQQMAPVLAGQWLPYLQRAMHDLRSGAKKGPKEMNSAIRELRDGEVEALLNYYASASQPGN